MMKKRQLQKAVFSLFIRERSKGLESCNSNHGRILKEEGKKALIKIKEKWI